MKRYLKKSGCSLVLAMLLTTVATAAWAASIESDQDRFYIRLDSAYNSFAGDFDGENYGTTMNNVANDNLFLLPEISGAVGAGITFGVRNEYAALEISYQTSNHLNQHWVDDYDLRDGEDFSAKYELYSFDIKVFAPNTINKRVKPYGLIGLAFPKLEVENGGFLTSNVDNGPFREPGYFIQETGDVNFTGRGFDLGIGLVCKLNSGLTLESSLIYRQLNLNKVKMFGSTLNTPDGVILISRNLNIGLNFHF